MKIKKSISNTAYMLAGIWTTWTITSGHTTVLGMTLIPMFIILWLCSLDEQGWEELKGGWFD
ncbi:hypothetical protein [Limosilactobacillus equigenerosi]|uniref:hypothetical protein n=1 Tax=Limosilactobacillus equigenerosi TaxID=417373 RepID=UPI0006D21B4A|nr:hypothetical protein [Limosilactobacillus equigenerosi]